MTRVPCPLSSPGPSLSSSLLEMEQSKSAAPRRVELPEASTFF